MLNRNVGTAASLCLLGLPYLGVFWGKNAFLAGLATIWAGSSKGPEPEKPPPNTGFAELGAGLPMISLKYPEISLI